MATVGGSYMNLADVRRQTDRNDNVADVIEIMNQQLEMLSDAPAIECNSGAEHQTTIRVGLPGPKWRKLYGRSQPTKGLMAQVKDTTGFLEDWVESDAKLVDMSKNPGKLRMNDAVAHLEGIAQEIGATVIYGDTDVNPERFMGLAPRYSSLTAANGNQIIDGGGTGSDNTSIWFIGWGEAGTALLYPEGSNLGIRRDDKGMQTSETSDGLMDVYREKFAMDVGLTVKDWRVNARVANIDVSELLADPNAGSSADLVDLMISAYYKLDNPNKPSTNTVIYTSRIIAEYLHKQAMKGTNMNLMLSEVEGRPIVSFLGHPIRRMDSILETEERVV